jgi:hypothetical protein
MKTGAIAISLALTLFVGATRANADDVNGAAKAFSQAQEAQLGGDVARAADLYELADELAPSAPALRNATRTRLAAGHLAMAATNAAQLLRRYPSDKESRDIAEAILSRLGPQLAQLDVTCTVPCTLLVDGKVVASVARQQHAMFIQPGARTIAAAFGDGRQASNQVTAPADKITTVRFEAPARPVAPKIAPKVEPATGAAESTGVVAQHGASRGLPRYWAIGGAVVTVGFGVATLVSGLSTLSTRDKIKEAVAAEQNTTAAQLYNTGRDQQTRTNIFLGATIAAGVGTVALAVFTNWSGHGTEHELAVVPSRDGGTVVYSGAF